MRALIFARRTLLAAALIVTVSPVPPVSALPTASFTYSPEHPATGEPVHFTFTGSCDEPPCSIGWRWFKQGGSSLGTQMGTGEEIDYTFAQAGLYSVVVKITNSNSTHGSATETHTIAVEDWVEETVPTVTLDSWTGVSDQDATGGTYWAGNGAGSRAALSFRGRHVTYVARTGPDRGIARLRVDGKLRRTVDLYSATPGSRTAELTRLGKGRHVVQVLGTGNKNAASSGTLITVDRIVAPRAAFEDNSWRITYDGWAGVKAGAASSGTARVATTKGATASFTFHGTGVSWVSATGPDHGIASVVLDGNTLTPADNYTGSVTWGVVRTTGGLLNKEHTLQVVATGEGSPASTGTRIVIDAFGTF